MEHKKVGQKSWDFVISHGISSILPLNCIKFIWVFSGCVRQYFDVKNCVFLPNSMRDFDHFYAKLLSGYQPRNNRCENRVFYLISMRVFPI